MRRPRSPRLPCTGQCAEASIRSARSGGLMLVLDVSRRQEPARLMRPHRRIEATERERVLVRPEPTLVRGSTTALVGKMGWSVNHQTIAPSA
jgi:hypothetical protein